MTEQALLDLGFSTAEAGMLSSDRDFHHKKKSAAELKAVFQKIADIYGCGIKEVMEAVLKFPKFAGLDHTRVVREATLVYGDSDAVKKAVLKHPPFAGYEHERVVREAAAVYGDSDVVKKAVLKHPQFAGYEHERVVREAAAVYGDAEAVKKAVLKFPQFAGYEHERVVREAAAVYGDAEAVKKAVLKFPQFAGYEHERVLRERTRLGRIVGMDKEEVIERILDNPVLAGYSAKRYIAALDVARGLAREGFTPDKIMLDAYFRYVVESPYVPGTKRLRISQAGPECPEPQLMNKMRRSLNGK